MNKKPITRRQFLIRAGTAAGGLIAANCGKWGEAGMTEPAVVADPTQVAAVDISSPADLVFTNGRVITVDSLDTISQAVAVKDGLIQQVGDSGELASRIGEATRVIDLAGRSLTPGLIDAHNHFQVMGMMTGHYISFNPPEVTIIAELQDKLAAVASETPSGEWIQGYYWSVTEGRFPNREDLDPVSPDHPVWIMQMGGHYGSANSRALEAAGIDASTQSPPGGYIAVDKNGDPTGVFYNHRAMDLLRKAAPMITVEDVRQNILSTQPMFAAVGVTTFHDNNVRGVDTVGAYMARGKEKEMTLRGNIFYTLEWPGDLDRALKEIEYYRDDYMRFSGFKFLLDGQAEMAFCHQPHNGVRWDMPTWDPKTFKNTVRSLHETGLQICVHCVGDAAVDLTLDAYEEAMNADPRPDPRHRIEHVILSTPDATLRMKDLGVIASVQPQFIRLGGDYWPTVFGEERSERIIVTREWIDAGVRVALGSDAPTTPWYTPQITLAGAVKRPTLTNESFGPEQCMTIEESMRAHTMGSAYAAFEEDIKGSIESGKLADMIVWKHDPYTSTLQEHGSQPIDITMVGGEIVYQT